MDENINVIPKERIIYKIILLRSEKVILDFHLAELYEVETRALKQAVRRNKTRFPEDFMFELSSEEIEMMVSQNVIPSKSYLGGAVPYAFTEAGVAMLSTVLKSRKAIEMNIAIIRTFIALRKTAADYKVLAEKLSTIEVTYDEQFREIYKALETLLEQPKGDRKMIGYKP
ncbi:MAG: ORF6N domain-containing protein [Sphingobacteriaceae bacterium]|nr:MAG: ORF6N domain-containing protein [Sphingobacteriaceae bacterium]